MTPERTNPWTERAKRLAGDKPNPWTTKATTPSTPASDGTSGEGRQTARRSSSAKSLTKRSRRGGVASNQMSLLTPSVPSKKSINKFGPLVKGEELSERIRVAKKCKLTGKKIKVMWPIDPNYGSGPGQFVGKVKETRGPGDRFMTLVNKDGVHYDAYIPSLTHWEVV